MKEEALSCFLSMHVRTKNPFGSRGRLFTFNVATESTCSRGVWERWGDTNSVFVCKLIQFVVEVSFICTLRLTCATAVAVCFGCVECFSMKFKGYAAWTCACAVISLVADALGFCSWLNQEFYNSMWGYNGHYRILTMQSYMIFRFQCYYTISDLYSYMILW